MPILTACVIGYWYSVCLLDNGQLFTSFRSEENVLTTYIDGELYATIVNGKEI